MNLFKSHISLFTLLLLQVSILEKCIGGQLEWKNASCHSMDERYAKFKLCELRKNNISNMNIFSMHLQLLQVPVRNCKLQIEFTLDNLVRPFNFNTTWDACEFMANMKRYRAMKIFYEIIGDYSNLNHSCPYDHDIVVAGLGSVNTNLYIPLISGTIAFRTVFITDGKVRLTVSGVAYYQNNVYNKQVRKDSRSRPTI